MKTIGTIIAVVGLIAGTIALTIGTGGTFLGIAAATFSSIATAAGIASAAGLPAAVFREWTGPPI